jgi:hypothetical protein
VPYIACYEKYVGKITVIGVTYLDRFLQRMNRKYFDADGLAVRDMSKSKVWILWRALAFY